MKENSIKISMVIPVYDSEKQLMNCMKYYGELLTNI